MEETMKEAAEKKAAYEATSVSLATFVMLMKRDRILGADVFEKMARAEGWKNATRAEWRTRYESFMRRPVKGASGR